MRYQVAILCVLFLLRLPAQNGWSLQQCIDYALKNNLSIKQSELNTQVSKNNLTQSKANLLPSLNAGAAHTYNFGRTIDRYTNKFADQRVLSQNFYVQSSVTLWGGLTQYNTVKQNEFTYLATVEGVNSQKNDLSLNVASAFLQALFNQELLEVAGGQVSISKEQLERTEKLADAGSIAKSNVYDIKAQLASDEYSFTVAENNLKISLLSLQQLLNLDTLKNFNIEKPLLDVKVEDVSKLNVMDIYSTALKNQPVIKSAELSWRASEKGYSAARGKISPSLTLVGTIGTGYSGLDKTYDMEQSVVPIGFTSTDTVYSIDYNLTNERIKPFSNQFKDNVNKSVGLQLNIPLFNGLGNKTAIQNARLNIMSQKYNFDLAKQQLFKNIAQAHANALAAFDKYQAAKIALEAAQTSFNFTETKFNSGTISAFDFSTAKNRLIKSQADLLNAKFDFIFKLKVLDFYQGKSLAF